MGPRRVLAGLRDTLRLLSPVVRAEREYTARRERLIAAGSEAALRGAPWLGPRHGAGFDERVVEYPWTFERLGHGDAVLDVGSTLNHETIHRLVLARYGRVIHLNPYRDDARRVSDPGVRYLGADVRQPPLRPAFAIITCLSTLEHIGCDNSRYGGGSARGDSAAARDDAMRAMRNLLGRGGRLLLTVPFGRFEDHGWFVQLDAGLVERAVAAFAPAARSDRYYLHRDGWREVRAADCADARYDQGNRGSGAVACLELTA